MKYARKARDHITGPSADKVSNTPSEPDVRPWVARLGSYVRIFGARSYHASGRDGPPGGGKTYLDLLEEKAKRNEGKFGRGK